MKLKKAKSMLSLALAFTMFTSVFSSAGSVVANAAETTKMVTIEAEATTVTTTTDVVNFLTSPVASNGYLVAGLGSANGGKMTFKVTANEAGTRKLDVHYAIDSAAARGLIVNVNGTESKLTCADSQIYANAEDETLFEEGWNVPESAPVSTNVSLKAGENIIEVYADASVDAGYAPNVDKFEIELTDAEAAATVTNMISNISATASAAKSVVLFKTGDDVDQTTTENGLKAAITSAVAKTYADVTDKSAITNKDVLISGLGTSKVMFPMEVETAELEGKAHIEEAAAASNGYQVGDVKRDDGKATLKVYAATAGTRNLNIFYSTNMDRDVVVTVNNTATTVDVPWSGDGELDAGDDPWHTPKAAPASVSVNLVAGDNTIVFTAPATRYDDEAEDDPRIYAPSLDKIEIEMTDAEAQQNVINMIDALPSVVSTADAMKVSAVEKSYSAVLDQSKVTNADKLAAALKMLANLRGERTPDADKPMFTIEAELGTYTEKENPEGKKVYVEENQYASNKHILKELGNIQEGEVSFEVTAEVAGERLLKLYYLLEGDRDFCIAVNGQVLGAVHCVGTTWDEPNNLAVPIVVTLNEGLNVITVSGIGQGLTPDLDRLELELTNAEAKKLVEDMIDRLPDVVTDENQYIIDGVQDAINNLPDGFAPDNLDKFDELLNGGSGEEVELCDLPIEAESCELAGSAVITEAPAASNGYVVSQLDDGSVTMYVESAEAVVRDVKVYFASAETRDLNVTANDELVGTVSCAGNDNGSWLTPSAEPETVAVPLKVGTNVIKFGAAEGKNAPNLDKFVISLPDADAQATVSGMIDRLPSVITEDNKMVVDGVKIAYDALKTKDAVTNYEKLETALDKIGNLEGNRVAEYGMLTFEGEMAELTNGAELEKAEAASNGTYIGKLGGTEDGTATFIVNVDEAGKRVVEVYYAVEGEGQLEVALNNESQMILKLKGESDVVPNAEPRKIVLDLVKGENAIAFSGVEGAKTPNVDKIKIELTNAEAVAAVIAMIEKIPAKDDITTDDKGYIDGVNDAYNELPDSDKEQVTNSDKLNEAKDKLEELENPTGSSEPTGSSDPTAPTEPTGSSDPTAPTEPTGSSNPTAPTDPSASVNPGANNQQQDTSVKVQNIKITGISKKIAAGKSIKLVAKVEPNNATNIALKWEVNNSKYASVNQYGKVKLKKAGKNKKVTVTATALDGSGVKASYTIKIMPKAVKKVVIEKPTTELTSGKKLKLTAVVTPDLASKQINKKLQWSSSKVKYATVSQKGVVKAKKAGKGKTVKITAKATDGSNKKAVIKLKIK